MSRDLRGHDSGSGSPGLPGGPAGVGDRPGGARGGSVGGGGGDGRGGGPGVPGPAPETPLAARRRGSVGRRVFYLMSAAIIVWASASVPLPYIEYVPGDPTEIPPLVEIEGVATTELDGTTALLTVVLRQQPTAPAITAMLDEHRRLVPIRQVYPAGIDRQDHLRAERERFADQFQVAAAVGARAAGVETEIVTEAVVLDVVRDAPADGLLEPGDVIVEVDGEPAGTAEELQTRIRAGEVGQELVLTVRRDGGLVDVPVVLGELPDSEHPVVGVMLGDEVDVLRLPFTVSMAEGTRIGGPSAGLMVALTVYDLLSEDDLLGGRTVVGTGSIDPDGRVGTVGGVAEKMLAAAAYGADLALVPAFQLDVAMTTAPDTLEVVGVSTLDEAIEVLRSGVE